MLNLPSFFLPVGLIAEDAAASRALVSFLNLQNKI